MPDFSAGLARGTWTGHLFGAQGQDQLQRLQSDFIDDAINHLAGVLDHVDDGEQDLTIGFTELLNYGRRLLGGTRYDLIGFTQGCWLLSGFKVFVNRILIEAGRRLPPTFNYAWESLYCGVDRKSSKLLFKAQI